MNKNINFLFFAFLLSAFISAQNKKIVFTTSYGIGYSDAALEFALSPYDEKTPPSEYYITNFIDEKVNAIGAHYNFELDYNISKNSYVGIGYAKQHHTKTNNKTTRLTNNLDYVYHNYQAHYILNFYEIHYKNILKNFRWGAGFFYYSEKYNVGYYEHSINGNDANIIMGATDKKGRMSSFTERTGIMGNIGYGFSITDYAKLGLQAKAYFNFQGGAIGASLAPFLSVSF